MTRTPMLLTLALAIPVLSSCSNPLQPEPLHAQSAEYAEIKGMLTTMLQRLDALEEGVTTHDARVSVELDSIGRIVNALGVEFDVTGSVSGYTQLEASLCGTYAMEGDARFQSNVTLRGQADGMLGVDAFGNGATGRVLAYGGQIVSVIPGGGVSLALEVCGKVVGEAGIEGAASVDATDPVIALLQGLAENVNTNSLIQGAVGRNMTGARAGQALDALSSLSMSNLPFGGGGASALINSLPLPDDIRGMINDPSRVFTRASSAGQFAIDRLCSSTLRVGEFADVVSAGCTLRNQVPSPQEVIGILSGLEGLPTTLQTVNTSLGTMQTSLGSLDAAMASVCNRVGSITGANLIIPSRSITILGNSYTTFPGYSSPLFPTMGAPSC